MFKHDLSKKFKDEIQKEYYEDNKKLDKTFKLNLKKLGYYK